MAVAIVRHWEIYTWPYLHINNQSTDFHKICCKMLVLPLPLSSEMKYNLCERIPLKIVDRDVKQKTKPKFLKKN